MPEARSQKPAGRGAETWPGGGGVTPGAWACSPTAPLGLRCPPRWSQGCLSTPCAEPNRAGGRRQAGSGAQARRAASGPPLTPPSPQLPWPREAAGLSAQAAGEARRARRLAEPEAASPLMPAPPHRAASPYSPPLLSRYRPRGPVGGRSGGRRWTQDGTSPTHSPCSHPLAGGVRS